MVDADDRRAQMRGFKDADQLLALMAKAAKLPRLPRWVWREYRAVFMGRIGAEKPRGALK